MCSLKVFLCDLCIILILGLNFLRADDLPKKSFLSRCQLSEKVDVSTGNCTCGGFNTTTPQPGSEPILSQMPGLVVKLDESGDSTCQALCLALAQATKAKGPEILCRKLKTSDELKLSAFFKVGDKPWSYVGMTAEEPLCCDNSEVKVCPSKANSTVVKPEVKNKLVL